MHIEDSSASPKGGLLVLDPGGKSGRPLRLHYRRFSDALPAVYANLLPSVLSEPLPVEEFASCADCAMARGANSHFREARRTFRADLKCCTFHPDLPNYLVGGLVAEGKGDGYDAMSAKIHARVGVEPGGIRPPPRYSVLYENGRKHGFGNSEALMCPYYKRDNGTCGIWSFRDAVCSTFHCKHIGGKQGEALWGTVKEYLSCIQKACAKYCLLTSDLDAKAAALTALARRNREGEISALDLDGKLDEEAYRRIWGNYYGSEEKFFRDCYGRISALASVDDILGVEQKANVVRLTEEMTRLTHLPKLLVRSPIRGKLNDNASAELIMLPDVLVPLIVPTALLNAFTEPASVNDVLSVNVYSGGLAQNRAMVWLLFRHGVLVDAD